MAEMIPAPCHPERPHIAKGLCQACYSRRYYQTVARTPAQKETIQRAKDAWKKTARGRARNMLAQARTNIRGIPFDLDISDVVIPSHCPVLGIPLDCSAQRPSDNLPSLDRIDNTKGYVKGNVWVISWRANNIKGDASLDELRALVRALEARNMEPIG